MKNTSLSKVFQHEIFHKNARPARWCCKNVKWKEMNDTDGMIWAWFGERRHALRSPFLILSALSRSLSGKPHFCVVFLWMRLSRSTPINSSIFQPFVSILPLFSVKCLLVSKQDAKLTDSLFRYSKTLTNFLVRILYREAKFLICLFRRE